MSSAYSVPSFNVLGDSINARVGHEPAREEVCQHDGAAIHVGHTHPTRLDVIEGRLMEDSFEIGPVVLAVAEHVSGPTLLVHGAQPMQTVGENSRAISIASRKQRCVRP